MEYGKILHNMFSKYYIICCVILKDNHTISHSSRVYHIQWNMGNKRQT